MSKIPRKHRSAPRFSPYFIKRLSSWLVLSTALTIAVRSASTLYWDSDGNTTNNSVTGTNLGGTGTWNTSSNTWWDGVSTTSDVPWNNSNLTTAVFSGTAGTVTLGQPIVANGLTFNTTGYTVAGTAANPLTLTGDAEVNVVNPADTAIITAVLAGSSGMVKTGAGLLRLGAANTYSGTTQVKAGGIVIAANSSTTSPAAVLTSGPLGTGSVVFDSGTSLLVDNTDRTIVNPLTFAGDITLSNTGTTLRTLTINSPMEFNGLLTGGMVINIPTQFLNVALAGRISHLDIVTSVGTGEGAHPLTKTGAGNITVFNATGLNPLAPFNIGGINSTATFNLMTDGNGTGSVETVGLGDMTWNPASGTVLNLTIGRSSAAGVLFGTALNKNLAPASFTSTLLGNGLTLTNNNNYGLTLRDDIAFNSVSATQGPTFNVSAASTSLQVQGLTLNGRLTGGPTGATAIVLSKTGLGTLVLGNNNATAGGRNTFGGDGSIIDVAGGVLQVGSDEALGDDGNVVRLNANAASGVGLRVTGDFATNRTIFLNQASNVIDVTHGHVFTINNALGLGAVANGLFKNDNGTLVLAGDNSTWTGGLTINDGAVRVTNSKALGTTAGTTVVAANIGAALELAGVTLAENISIGSSGVNSTGALLGFSGDNTLSGTVTLTAAATIGVNSGATLNLNASGNGIGGAFNLTLGGGGTGSVNTVIATGAGTLTKFGSGTWTLTQTNTFTGATAVNAGNLVLSGAAGSAATSASFTVNSAGTLTLDNSGANPTVANRLGGKAVTLSGGTLSFVTNAANSTESAGNLAINSGGSVISIAGAGAGTLGFGTLTFGTGGTLNVTAANLGTTNKITFSTAPTLIPATTGILPRVTVNGTDFATYGAGGLAAFTGYYSATDFNLSAATDVVKVTAATSAPAVTKTISSLVVSGNGLTVGGAPGVTLTLTGGGILVTGGSSTLNVPFLATGSAGALFHIDNGSSLNSSSVITGTGGLIKALEGDLTLSARNYFTGTTTVNAGRLELSGGNNTLYVNQGLAVNAGATLDLNGSVQYTGTLSSGSGAVPGAGGTITGDAGSVLAVRMSGDATFAGRIRDGVSLVRSGGSNLFLSNVNDYTGSTFVTGGVLRIRDDGALTSTSGITLNYGTLYMDDNNLSSNTNRISDTAGITMNGGVLSLYGRAGAFSSETVGVVRIDSGTSTISASTGSNAGQYAPQTSILTLTGLSRNEAAGATLTFAQNYSGSSTGQLGTLAGLSPVGHRENILIAGGVNLTNRIIGPWAVVNSGYFNTSTVEWASYINDLGVGALNIAGFAGYDASLTNAAPTASSLPGQNVRIAINNSNTVTFANGGLLANTLNVADATTSTNINLAFANANDVLNLAGGGLIIQNIGGTTSGTATLGTTLVPGVLTAGGTAASGTGTTDLYFYYYNHTAANVLTVNSKITNNAVTGDAVRLIYWGGNQGVSSGTPVIVLANAENDYAGGTVVNQTQVDIGVAGGAAGRLPGGGAGLTINGGIVRQINGTIAAQAVTLNGSSTLTLTGNNTLTSLTFNNNGGTGTPTVTVGGGTLTLTGATPISATSSNVATLPVIQTGTLDLGNGTKTIMVDAIKAAGQTLTTIAPTLNISAVIAETGGVLTLNKTGDGLLQLSGQNTFTGGVNVLGGGIILGANSNPSTVNATVTDGPLGTGALTMAGGTALLLDNVSRSVANTVSFGGDVRFDNTGTSGVTLALNGGITLASGTMNIDVVTPGLTTTFGGAIAATTTDMVKNGLGTLSLTNAANAFNGVLTVNGGLLTVANEGALGVAPTTFLSNAITLNGGGFGVTGNTVLGLNRGIILNGGGTLTASSGTTLTVIRPVTGTGGLNVVGTGTVFLAGNNTFTGGITVNSGTLVLGGTNTLTKPVYVVSGAGISIANGPSAIGNQNLYIDSGTLGLLYDGDGTGKPETYLFPTLPATITGNISVRVDRVGTTRYPYFTTALNKTIQYTWAGLTNNTNQLSGQNVTITAANQYGLELTDGINMSNSVAQTITVTGATTSNQVPALTLSGAVSGGRTGAANTVLTKSGNGTLVLSNAGNTFGGNSSIIDITAGNLGATSDGALGNSTNVVRISTNSTTTGFRAMGNIDTTRTFFLNNTNSAIDVTAGNTLILRSAFGLSAPTNNLVKNDRGTLELAAANAGWNGGFTLNQGVVRVTNATSLGSTVGGTTIGNLAGQIQISGGITVAEAISIAGANNQIFSGVDSTGMLRSTAGVNTWAGLISLTAPTTSDSQARGATITVDDGSTLTVSGGLTAAMANSGSNRDMWFGFGGAGTGFITTNAITQTGATANNYFSLEKFGTGTWNFQVANGFNGHTVYVNAGTLALNAAGSFGAPSAGGGTNTVYVTRGGTLELNNSTTNVDNRLGGARNLYLRGGNLTIIGNSGANTTETVTGTLTFDNGTSVITLDADANRQLNFTTGAVTRNNGSGGVLLLRADGLGSAAGNGVATMQGGVATYAFVGQTGGTGTTNKGILPWAIGDTNLSGAGIGFLTLDSNPGDANGGTNRLRLLTASEMTSSFGTSANVSLSGSVGPVGPVTVNSLTLANNTAIAVNPVSALNLESGGLLALGNATINGGFITTSSNRELIVHSLGDVTIGSNISLITGGLTKSGAGVLALTGTNTYTGTTNINQGTLKLGADATNSIFYNNTMVLQGGFLDLNGGSQVVNNLQSVTSAARNANYVADSGGTVINTGTGMATLGMTTANVNFAGAIGGANAAQNNIAVVRSQSANSFQDWNLYSANPFTGPLLLNGGRTQLLGTGTILKTTAIELAQSTLLVTNNNATGIADVNLNDRVNDAATILMRGAMFQYRNRFSEFGFEKIGAVTLAEGQSVFDVSPGGTGNNQGILTMASLAREDGSHATLRFFNVGANIANTAQIFITANPILSQNLIGGWAVFEREFASYTPGIGVGALNSAGYAGYSPNSINSGLTTDNVRVATIGTTTLTGDRDINSLAMVVAGATTLDLGGGTLSLRSGGLIASNATNNTAITIQNGNLTAGAPNVGGDLYLHTFGYVNGNTDVVNRDVVVNANIVDNGTGAVTLVINGDDGRGTGLGGLLGGSATILTGNNTHSGGTFVNAGRVILNNASADGQTTFAVPGNLTITGGASTNGNTAFERTSFVQFGAGNQLKNTSIVTLNGGAILDLNGYNQTIGGLVINNTGGYLPTLSMGANGGSMGTVFLEGDLTASGSNLGAVSTIGGAWMLGVTTGSTAPTVTVGSTAGLVVGMSVSGPGVPTGATIAKIVDGTTFELSVNATGGSTGYMNFTLNPSTLVGQFGTLDLKGGTRTFTVDAVKANDVNIAPLLPNLNITASIANGGIVKKGDGLLQLSAGGSTFGGGMDLQQGGLMISTNSTPITPGVTSGPLGTGALTISGNNTVLTADGTARTVSNDVTFGNAATNITIGNAGAAGLTLAGQIFWSDFAGSLKEQTIAVNSNFNGNAQTLSGQIVSAFGDGNSLTKTGNGILAITGVNSMSLWLTGSQAIKIAAGTLQINSDAALGAAPDAVVDDNIVLMGGALSATATTTLNINRGITVVGGQAVFDVTAGTFTIPSAITSATDYNLTKTGGGTLLLSSNTTYGHLKTATVGAGTLALNLASVPSGVGMTVGGGTTLSLRWDGLTGGGERETKLADFGSLVFQGNSTVNVGRLGTTFTPFYPLAGNKTIQIDMDNTSFVLPNSTLTVTNSDGYGLQLVDSSISVNSVSTYSVGTYSTSNAVQGLTIDSKVTGTGTLTKAGNGVLALGNTGNDFTGNVVINAGVVAAGSNAQLGAAANRVVIGAATGTTAATFRATGDITTGRTFQFGVGGAKTIEVVEGRTLQLNSAFDFTGVSGAALNLAKNDGGILALNASNAGWAGTLVINGGAVRVLTNNAVGSTNPIQVAGNNQAALQLAGVTVSNPINLNTSTSANLPFGGLQFGGQLEAVSGTNTYSGAITLSADAAIGARAGSTLNITGGISMATATIRALYFNAEAGANINLSSALTGGAAAGWHRIEKYGDGKLTITSANAVPMTGSPVRVQDGVMELSGAGTLSGVTGGFEVYTGGEFVLDNTGTNLANRTGTAIPIRLLGGALTYKTKAGVATTEADFGALNIGTSAAAGGATIKIEGVGPTTNTFTFASLGFNVGNTANFIGTFGAGVGQNKIVFTAPPTLTPATTGILARATVTNAANTSFDFATYSVGTGLVAFTNYATIFENGAATDVVKLTGDADLAVSRTLTGLALNGSGIDVTGNDGATLTLSSGGVLVTGGTNNRFTVPVLAFGAAEGIFHINAGSALTLGNASLNGPFNQNGGSITGTAGLTKADGGDLILESAQYYTGATYLNGGTLKLVSGATNTLMANQRLSVSNGLLDLNGGVQVVGDLTSASTVNGGTITSTSGAQAMLLTNSTGTVTFAGRIIDTVDTSTHVMSFGKTGQGTLTLTSDNTYTGKTFINGGTLTLIDSGKLSGTTGIEISNATLSISNNGILNDTDRVKDNAAILLTAGGLTFTGRSQVASSEKVGQVTLGRGYSTITVTNTSPIATGATSAELILGGFLRDNANAGVVNFVTSGLTGNNSRLIIANKATQAFMGPWAIVNGTDFAGYNFETGVGALSAVGYAGYQGTSLDGATSTMNIKTTVPTTVIGGVKVNSLNLAVAAAGGNVDIAFNGDNVVLDIVSGGLLKSGGAGVIGGTDFQGILTSTGTGTKDFYLTNAGTGQLTVRSRILDGSKAGGTGSLRLIVSSTGANTFLEGLNNYTGGTVINGLVTVDEGFLPGSSVVVNNGILAIVNGSNVGIDDDAVVELHNAKLDLQKGSNTLMGLKLFNDGSSGSLVSSKDGILTVKGDIESTPTTVGGSATTPQFLPATIEGLLDLDINSRIIRVSPTLVNGVNVAPTQSGLTITAAISKGGIVKTGGGVLSLNSSASTFTGGVDLQAGGLMIGASSLPAFGTLASGPLGTGMLKISGTDTMLLAGINNAFIRNAALIQHGFNFDMAGSVNPALTGPVTLTLAGTIELADSMTIGVINPNMTAVLAGDIRFTNGLAAENASTITKVGLGNLVINDSYTGTVNASGPLSLYSDGDGMGTPESIQFGAVTMTGGGVLNVGRLSTSRLPLYTTAANKTIVLRDLDLNGALTVNNLGPATAGLGGGGYGLEIGSTGSTTLASQQTIAVTTATASNVVPGLTWSGVINGTGGITKAGNGTLVLNNSGNTFTGPLNVQAGVLGATSNGALGAAANEINLNAARGSIAAFEAFGDINTSRKINLIAPTVTATGNGSSTITVSSTTGLFVGERLTGAGITGGSATITSIVGNTVTLSNTVAAGTRDFSVNYLVSTVAMQLANSSTTVTPTLIVNSATVNASNVVTVASVTGLLVGQPISGTNIPSNTVITEIIDATHVRISQAATAAGTNLNLNVSVGAGSFFVGQTLIGPGIPVGAVITAVNPYTLTISVGTSSTAASASANVTVVNPNAVLAAARDKTLTLTTPFGGTQSMVKIDPGTVVLAANNSTWAGQTVVYGGVLRLQNSGALGVTGAESNTIVLNHQGSALQLDGGAAGLTITEQLDLSNTGLDSGGALQSLAGTGANTVSGQISLSNAAKIGADANSVLNITGGIVNAGATAQALTLGGGGTININSALNTLASITKVDSGTAVLGTANGTFTGALTVSGGTFALANAGIIGGTGAIAVQPGGTLLVDNTAANVSNRLGGRAITLTGGTLNFVGRSGVSSTETAGALAISRGGSTITSTAGGSGGTSTLTFASLTPAGDSSMVFSGAGLGGASNKIIFTTAPSLNDSIIARAVVTADGAFEFATYASGTGIAAYTAYTTGDINAAGSTANYKMTTGGQNLTLGRTINSLAMVGNGLTLTGAANQILTIDAGGVLANGGTSTVSAAGMQFTNQAIFHVNTGSTMTVNSALSGTVGLVKADGGTLVLAPSAGLIPGLSLNTLTGNVSINGGTLKLAGGTNTLFPNQYLIINPGGTLDLNGTAQQVRGLLSDTTITAGGTIGNSAASEATLVVNTDTRTWTGSIMDNVTFVRSGGSTLTMIGDNSYTGRSIFNAGTTILRDAGALSGTSALDLFYATLTLDNATSTMNLNNRINDAAPIEFRGAVLTLLGGAQAKTVEKLGAVTVQQGHTIVTVTPNTTPQSEAQLTLQKLSVAALTPGEIDAATINFTGTNFGTLGSSGRVVINDISSFAATLNASHIIGGWAVVGTDFASYNSALGVGALGQNGFAGYDVTHSVAGTSLSSTLDGTKNLLVTVTPLNGIPGGGLTVNAMKMSGSFDLTFTGSGLLNIRSGGLILTGNNNQMDIAGGAGQLTAGGSTSINGGVAPLYLYNNANTYTINAQIVDNSSSTDKVRLVIGATGGTIALTNINNSYTGGTVVNGGTLALNATTANAVLPGGLSSTVGSEAWNSRDLKSRPH